MKFGKLINGRFLVWTQYSFHDRHFYAQTVGARATKLDRNTEHSETMSSKIGSQRHPTVIKAAGLKGSCREMRSIEVLSNITVCNYVPIVRLRNETLT